MTQQRTVLVVVLALAGFALVGLGGLIYLVDAGTAPEAIAIIAGPTGVALGALGSMLNSTRTAEAEVELKKATPGLLAAATPVARPPAAPPPETSAPVGSPTPAPAAERQETETTAAEVLPDYPAPADLAGT